MAMIFPRNYTLVSFTIVVVLTVSYAYGDTAPYTNKELMTRLIDVNDRVLATELGRQLRESGDRYHGALFDADSVVSPIRTSHFILTLLCSYVSKDSKYYKS